ncbi:MAG: tRNA uridine-5-carboxymethylaminomethyl(34) synthesis GTPase MnmE, partial [Bacteroidota bacterium]|nr:tRNA uridine-5-carboxymethylaminomethyl(34) synthesis GTPase MnmE [Bacteroidota bacterium]
QQIGDNHEGAILTNHRHLEAINLCLKDLEKVNVGIKNNSSGEFLAMDIRQALHHLGTITGEVSNEELLGNIFSNFCIGK